MEVKELEVIANRAFSTYLCEEVHPRHLAYELRRSNLEEDDCQNLEPGHTRDTQLFGRVQNPQQLGDLNVIWMDFRSRSGDQLPLLILNIPAKQGFSTGDIIRCRFADLDFVMVRNPVMDGRVDAKVIVALAPCFVEAITTQGMTRTVSSSSRRDCAAVASYHLRIGNAEEALRIIQAAINAWGPGSLEELCIQGQAATRLQLYDVAAAAYTASLNLAPEQQMQVSEQLEVVKKFRAQAIKGDFRDVADCDLVDYVSEKLQVRRFTTTVGVFAKELIHAGEVVMVSNGIEDGFVDFAMVLDACSKSSRLARQVEMLWLYKMLDAAHLHLENHKPEIVSAFRPAQELDEDADLLVYTVAVWCAVKRARIKGNGSSLWPFACFFKELAEDNNNLEVQLNGRTMVLRAKRDVKLEEELSVPAKMDVIETLFFYEDGGLVREETLNGGETVVYDAWAIVGELPPADTDWCSFVERYPLATHGRVKLESDGLSTDEIVAELLEESWKKRKFSCGIRLSK